MALLQDDLDMVKCKILHNPRLQLFVYPDPYRNPNPNGDQVVETEESQVPLNSIGDLIYGEDMPLTTEEFMNIRAFPTTTEDIFNGHHQDSSVRNNDQSPPTVAAKQNVHPQDSTVTVLQELKTEKSPRVGKIIRIVLFVLPYSGERKDALTIRGKVNTKHQVRILREELIQKQLSGHLNLPQDTYFFVHKQRVLSEDGSFEWNCIGHNDTIQIVRDPWLNK